MRMRTPWMLTLTLLAACGAQEDAGDPRVVALREGELPADNLIIYDRGRRKTMGTQVLGASGSFELAGPTVVYVFRSFNPDDAEQMQRDGIVARENSAYLLPSGASPTLDALQRMQLIGPIDPAMDDEQLALKFRLGEAGVAAAGGEAAPPPVRPEAAGDSTPSAGAESESAAPAAIGLQAARERLERPRSDAPMPAAVEDARVAELGGRLNQALASLAVEMRDGADSQATRENIRDIQLELQGLIADQGLNDSGGTASTSPAVPTAPDDDFRQPARATCSSYNALDQSAPATASINSALTAYAEGFAGGLIDYQACGAATFDEAGYIDHLASFCRAQPEKTVQDSVLSYVCGDSS